MPYPCPCTSGPDTLLLTSQCYSQSVILAVDVARKQVSQLSPPAADSSKPSSWTLLAISNRTTLVASQVRRNALRPSHLHD